MAFVFLCPRCSFTTKQEPKFADHLGNSHEIDLFAAYAESKGLTSPPACGCGCGSPAPWKGWKGGFSEYVRGHNARVSSCFSDPETIDRMRASRQESREAGKWKPWNAGLTKETSRALRSAGEKKSKTLREKYTSGEITPWQLGLSKETSDSIRRSAQTRSDLHAKGKIKSWNDGLTKETSQSLASAAKKISESYSLREAGRRLSSSEVESRAKALGFEIEEDRYSTRKGWGLTVTHLKCGTRQVRSLYSLETGLCISCDVMTSSGQREVEAYVRSIIPDIVASSRSVIPPLEIDVWVPSHNFGVEFNGLYWHSEKFCGRDYHGKKSAAVRAAGGNLLHVFEDEWRDKRPIVESMIASRLGLSGTTVGARKCRLSEIAPSERKEFFDSSHIDGDARAAKAWGLYLGETLVCALSVRRPMHRKWSGWLEISRFATRLGHSVPGGLSRLLAAALLHGRESGAKGLMTYADLRHGEGKSYEKAGFKLEGETAPRFWWTDGRRRLDRFSIRADRSVGATEQERAKEAGVTKLWGCGNRVFSIEFSR